MERLQSTASHPGDLSLSVVSLCLSVVSCAPAVPVSVMRVNMCNVPNLAISTDSCETLMLRSADALVGTCTSMLMCNTVSCIVSSFARDEAVPQCLTINLARDETAVISCMTDTI